MGGAFATLILKSLHQEGVLKHSSEGSGPQLPHFLKTQSHLSTSPGPSPNPRAPVPTDFSNFLEESPPTQQKDFSISHYTQLFSQILEKHRQFNSSTFLQEIGPPTLHNFLHYLDLGKSLFLKEDILAFQEKYATHWLQDILVHKDFASLHEMWKIREKRLDHAFTFLAQLELEGHEHEGHQQIESEEFFALTQDQYDYAQDLQQWEERLIKIHHFTSFLSYVVKREITLSPQLWDFSDLQYQNLHSLSQGHLLDYLFGSIFRNFGDSSWMQGDFSFQHEKETAGINFAMSPYPAASKFFLDLYDGFPKIRSVEGFFKNYNTIRRGDRVVGFLVSSTDSQFNTQFLPVWPFSNYFQTTQVFKKAHKLFRKAPHNILSLKILRRNETLPLKTHLIDIPLNSYDPIDHPPYGEDRVLTPRTPPTLPPLAKSRIIEHTIQMRGQNTPRKTVVIRIDKFDIPQESSSSSSREHGFECLQKSCRRYQTLLAFTHNLVKIVLEDRSHLLIVDLRGVGGGDYELAELMLAPLLPQDLPSFRTGPGTFRAETSSQTPLTIYPGRLIDQLDYEQVMRDQFINLTGSVRRHLSKIPLVVMVDHHSAAAAEYWASEIKARKRGIIVGSPHTAGDSSLHEHYGFENGKITKMKREDPRSLISLEVAKVYGSTGEELPSTGLRADLILPHLNHHLRFRDSLNSLIHQSSLNKRQKHHLSPQKPALQNLRTSPIMSALRVNAKNLIEKHSEFQEFGRQYALQLTEPINQVSWDPDSLIYSPIPTEVSQEMTHSSTPSLLFLEHYTQPLSPQRQNIDLTLSFSVYLGTLYSIMLSNREDRNTSSP